MDNGEKTYMWLIIIAFIGFAIATGFALMESKEMSAPIEGYSANPFQ